MKRDPSSLLYQLCEDNPPILPDADGSYFFDRDWWLFRYIVIFLRDGTLPEDRSLLAQLYREAGFWHLNELQTAIEENKLHLRGAPKAASIAAATKTIGKDGKMMATANVSAWWRKSPNWQQTPDNATKAATAAKNAPADWWTGTTYNGRNFLPLSNDPLKVITTKGSKDQKASTENVWYSYSDQKKSGGGHGISPFMF